MGWKRRKWRKGKNTGCKVHSVCYLTPRQRGEVWGWEVLKPGEVHQQKRVGEKKGGRLT